MEQKVQGVIIKIGKEGTGASLGKRKRAGSKRFKLNLPWFTGVL